MPSIYKYRKFNRPFMLLKLCHSVQSTLHGLVCDLAISLCNIISGLYTSAFNGLGLLPIGTSFFQSLFALLKNGFLKILYNIINSGVTDPYLMKYFLFLSYFRQRYFLHCFSRETHSCINWPFLVWLCYFIKIP